MNKRLFSLALLVSSLPAFSSADFSRGSLNEGDFISSEKRNSDGDKVVRVKLSKSGKAKLKRLRRKK